MNNACGLLVGADIHHLDHLAPLCDFLSIPLVITESTLVPLIEKFYPNLQLLETTPSSFTEIVLRSYDVAFTCLPMQLIEPLFFFDERRLGKKILTFWIPHGQSDKDNLGALTEEKLALVYGPQMLDIFKSKGVLNNLVSTVPMGNFRYHYYNQRKTFYDKLLNEQIQFPKDQKILFYAPSWNGSSVKDDLREILRTLPTEMNLLIKLHPNTLREGFAEPALERASKHRNVQVLQEIPTIYPILNRCDIYIGDSSSIAYDFLSFNRPIFLLSSNQTVIHHASNQVETKDLFEKITNPDEREDARKSSYEYAFDTKVDYTQLPQVIRSVIDSYFENEVHLQ